MPSSTNVAPAVCAVPPHEHLLALLAGLDDPRKRRGRVHPVAGLVAVAIAATVAGMKGFTAIGQWAANAGAERLAALGLDRGVADESTFRRVFARLDADALDKVLGLWASTRAGLVDGRRVYAIDGKTVRGARKRHKPARRYRGAKRPAQAATKAPHLVAALLLNSGTSAAAGGLVVGQVAVEDKTNEIPAARDLLKHLHDDGQLAGAVVTMDAVHTQHETAKQIIAAGADYVFTVKANQKGLYTQLKALPWADITSHRTTDPGRGRRATRSIKVADLPEWIEFTGAKQVAQLRRTRTVEGKKSIEVVYLITSADHRAAPPAVLAAWVRSHWGIENRLHWVRDVTYDEDRSQVRTGAAPRVMATLRNTAISLLRIAGWANLAEAHRHHAARPDDTTNLVLTA